MIQYITSHFSAFYSSFLYFFWKRVRKFKWHFNSHNHNNDYEENMYHIANVLRESIFPPIIFLGIRRVQTNIAIKTNEVQRTEGERNFLCIYSNRILKWSQFLENDSINNYLIYHKIEVIIMWHNFWIRSVAWIIKAEILIMQVLWVIPYIKEQYLFNLCLLHTV